MAEVEAGDVVKLKSGGPKMTLLYVDDEGVMCVWFSDVGEYKTKRFVPQAASGAFEVVGTDFPDVGFNVGDVVQLRSGGPIMTVIRVHQVESIMCAWFRQGDRVEQGHFGRKSLREHGPGEGAFF